MFRALALCDVVELSTSCTIVVTRLIVHNNAAEH